MKRHIAILLLALGLAPGTWWRTILPPPSQEQVLRIEPIAPQAAWRDPGPFRLAGAWRMSSPNEGFGGYSGLVMPAPGRLLAFSDRGYLADFAVPGGGGRPPRLGPVFARMALLKANRDIESATRDPATGRIWLGMEGRNAVVRFLRGIPGSSLLRLPNEMRHWPSNTGPEALVRLADGRFLIACECDEGWKRRERHPALLFEGDPVEPVGADPLTLILPAGYRPTDMALLPDGRVLMLARRVAWPFPPRFTARLLLLDPSAIRPGVTLRVQLLAELAAPLPVDNMEALAVEQRANGELTAWLMSDDNEALTQRSVLLKLDFSLAALPPKQKAPGLPGRP